MSELEPTRTYSNPTANDILRCMLDERGVEHEDDEGVTRFFGPDGFEVVMQEDIDGKLDCLTPLYLTPEQAIAATLGATDARPTQAESSGTCHVESSIIDTYEYNRWEYELSCGHTIIWGGQ